MQLIWVFPVMNTADSIKILRNLLSHGTRSLLWILPSDYFSTDSKQYLTR